MINLKESLKKKNGVWVCACAYAHVYRRLSICLIRSYTDIHVEYIIFLDDCDTLFLDEQ